VCDTIKLFTRTIRTKHEISKHMKKLAQFNVLNDILTFSYLHQVFRSCKSAVWVRLSAWDSIFMKKETFHSYLEKSLKRLIIISYKHITLNIGVFKYTLKSVHMFLVNIRS